ncbi:MAG: tetratricopeptide repeat protein, partial [Deltaproteobacteria bacterium]|nr:tetratricopeptide repeat protein [Deltaproteobacteria bacterium]
TLTRTTDTTVIVKDENTVVIGGIIGETDEKGEYKVPILGDIPILGNLFRSKSSNLDRTNLFIFLTPHIIENPIEAKNVYDEKKGQIDTIKEGTVKLYDGRPKQSEDMKLCDKGYSHLRAKDYEKAMKYYQNAIKINPENPYALLNMGVIYETQGEMDKASEMYKDLISLDPDERAFTSSDPAQIGRKLSDIARDNLKRLEESR